MVVWDAPIRDYEFLFNEVFDSIETVQRLGYDDFAGIDVSGKVVLILRYEPGHAGTSAKFQTLMTSSIGLRKTST